MLVMMFYLCFIAMIFNLKSFLSMLISIEGTMLVCLVAFMSLSMSEEFLVLLTLAAAEATLGMTLLVKSIKYNSMEFFFGSLIKTGIL